MDKITNLFKKYIKLNQSHDILESLNAHSLIFQTPMKDIGPHYTLLQDLYNQDRYF